MHNNQPPAFPENPTDGQVIKQHLEHGGYVRWCYHQQQNTWSCEAVTAKLAGYIYADQVLRRDTPEDFATKGELAALQAQVNDLFGRLQEKD